MADKAMGVYHEIDCDPDSFDSTATRQRVALDWTAYFLKHKKRKSQSLGSSFNWLEPVLEKVFGELTEDVDINRAEVLKNIPTHHLHGLKTELLRVWKIQSLPNILVTEVRYPLDQPDGEPGITLLRFK